MLKEVIKYEIETKRLKYGCAGTEPVSVIIELTKELLDEWESNDIEEEIINDIGGNLYWELENNMLTVSYSEE